MEATRDEWLARFDLDASVEHAGVRHQVPRAEIEALRSSLRYWHPDGPSTWLVEAVVNVVRRRTGGRIPRATGIELVAGLLRTTPARVEDSLDWTAHYMAHHDGGDPGEHHPWPRE